MNCPSCGSANEAGRKFCGECGTKLAAPCPTCGTVNNPGARFCGECGTALQAGPGAAIPLPPRPPFNPSITPGTATGGGAGGEAAATGPVAERRLVTVLFADLVGFTSLSEGRDPEEVRELLSHYFDVAREQIERYGGTVEKFIGDAVMAVWGAPTAHEDDAERAVRAGLELVDAVKDLAPGLQARAGVLTGEAAVTVGARGQGMVAGDLVNTASRLQSAASPGMVFVGETTQRVTSESIAYEPAGEHTVKGKTVPVTAYRAVRVVAERGGRGRGDRLEAPFVGRDSELRLLKDLLHATAREKRVRLVSITGQGGIGKSRLTWELKKYVDGIAEDVWWHEGRSPAYGSGITFWALGEMVRARAELVETEEAATTRAKLGESVARFVSDGPDRARVEAALGTLLGVSDAPAASAGELYGAWRLYFERMAAEGLVVMVFEDLHWADPGLLDFIDHMLEWSRNVPILIVTLARPELLDKRSDWGAGRRNFLALDLEPLDDASMRGLLAGFVPGLSEAAIRSIVTRAEGIPLYAVETIRMLVADGRLRALDGGGFEPEGELGELAVPGSLHALIAARLDGLEPDERALIQDAAVLGQSFSVAGLSAVSGLSEANLGIRLRSLVRADLLIEEIDPRSPERGQYAFVQALIREVAYSTLSLKDRRARHVAAARFFESLGDDEIAGALASHYLAAYRATPPGDEAAALAAQARLALRGAAERAAALGSQRQALAFLQQALEVATEDSDRAELMERAMDAGTTAADYDTVLDLAPQLRALREAMQDRPGAALAVALECDALYQRRDRERALQLASEAVKEFEDLGDHVALVRLLGTQAGVAVFTRQYELGMSVTDRALGIAERIGDAEQAARILMLKGQAAFFQGRLWEAVALTEGARRLAEQHGLTTTAQRVNGTLTSILALDDPRATAAVEKEIIAYARRQGRRESEVVMLGNVAEDLRRTGDWDWIINELNLAVADEDSGFTDLIINAAQAFFRIYRGQVPESGLESVLGRIAAVEDKDVASAEWDLRGAESFVAGEFVAAAQHWFEQAERSDLNAPYALPKAGVAAVLGRDAEMAKRVLERLAERGIRGRAIEADRSMIQAGIDGLQGDKAEALAKLRTAAAAYQDLGLAWDGALLGLVGAVVVGVDDPEVAGWLGEARATFERVQSAPMLRILDGFAATVWSGRETASIRTGTDAPSGVASG